MQSACTAVNAMITELPEDVVELFPFDDASGHLVGRQLAAELGLRLPIVNMPDPTLVNKTYVPDTWKTGITQLPYPKEIVASFLKFREDVLRMKIKERMAELDALPFSKFTAAYAPEVQQWWDMYGPSNWGATTPDTSAYVGLYNANDIFTGGDGKRAIATNAPASFIENVTGILLPAIAGVTVLGLILVIVGGWLLGAHGVGGGRHDPESVASRFQSEPAVRVGHPLSSPAA